MHVRTDLEPSSIHAQNILPTLCKLLVFIESYTNSRSRITISTVCPRGLINHFILVSFRQYCVSVCNQSLVREVNFLTRGRNLLGIYSLLHRCYTDLCSSLFHQTLLVSWIYQFMDCTLANYDSIIRTKHHYFHQERHPSPVLR